MTIGMVHLTSHEIEAASWRGAIRRRRLGRHRRLLHLTDRAIERLEELNLADKGASPPDPGTARTIETALRAMPPPVRRSFPGQRTVQQALDGMFTMQSALQKQRQAELWWDL